MNTKNIVKYIMKNNYLKIDNYFYLYLFLITFFSIYSQYLFKNIQKNKNSKYNNFYLIISLIMYLCMGFFIYKLLFYGNLLILNIVWHVIYFIVLFLISYFLFNEKINYGKIVALLFGLLSLIIFMFYGVE